jgi:hypothetical protein
MSAIGTSASYGSDISNLLLANSSSPSSAADVSSLIAPSRLLNSAGNDRAPATQVELSDKVKEILARASTDQDVADRLKAFVESHRIIPANSSAANSSASDIPPPSSQSAPPDANQASEQPSGGTQVSDGAQNSAPVQAPTNFASSLTVDGYSISAWGPGLDGNTRIAIHNPDGSSFFQRSSGTGAGTFSFDGLDAGAAVQAYQRDNKEYITFAQSETAATSVTASSDAGSVSATSAATHAASVTFVVDFNTGGLSILRSESTSVATSVQINRPGSTYSAVA